MQTDTPSVPDDERPRAALLADIGRLTAHAEQQSRRIQALEAETAGAQARLDEERRRTEEAMRAKSDFLANMSHEIRTPMNSILGMSYLALKSGLNVRQRNYVQKVHRSAELLLALIDDILDYSRIEAGKLEMESAPFALNSVMEHLASMVGLSAEDKGLELLFDQPADLPLALVGDSLRLGQVLANLCTNAVKFTHAGEVIVAVKTLAREASAVELEFAVSDTGIGMDEGERSRLFMPFTQADGSISRRFGGMGLGLAISHHLVKLMGGKLWVESEPGRGSTFRFTARFGLQQPAQKAAREEGAPRDSLAGMRALVVDDNASAREILVDMSRSFGLAVEEATDGWDALRSVMRAAQAGRPFELMLLDWKMPGMDGVECAQQLNAQLQGTRPTIMMTTAFGRDELLQHLREAEVSVSDVLVKPVTPSNLFESCCASMGHGLPLRARVAQAQEEALRHRERLRGVHLLLVDDNEFNQELATEMLTDEGIRVTVAANGRQAIELLGQHTFDGVLMDCQMPLMDGYSATRELRAQPRFAALPIIAMTADAMRGDHERALAAGMNDHIAKPIDIDAMFATIARWVRPEAPPAVAPVAVAAVAASGSPSVSAEFTLASMVGIDVAQGLVNTNNNEGLYRRLLAKFAKSQPAFESKFQAARAADDEETARRLAHDLTTSSGTLGAKALYESARALEHACREQAEQHMIDSLLQCVATQLGAVIDGLQRLEPPPPR